MVKVKICGITNWTDARRAAEAGADFLGFNFYRKSPRYIAPGAARRITRRLPRRVAKVGVFVNETEEKIAEIVRVAGLDGIQLHGDESPAMVARLRRALPGIQVMKAVRVRNGFRLARLARFEQATSFLLDGFDRLQRGGTGKTFDWKIARAAKKQGRIFLAGGLKPENVVEAIRAAKPYAIDVCSGVETRPGKKDPARMKAVMQAVKAAQRKSR